MGNVHPTNQTPDNLFRRPFMEPVTNSDLPTEVQDAQARRNRPLFNKEVKKRCQDVFQSVFDRITEMDGEAAAQLQATDLESSELNRGQRFFSTFLAAWQLGIIVPEEQEGSPRPRSLSSTSSSGKGSFSTARTKARVDKKMKDRSKTARERMLGKNAARNRVKKPAARSKFDSTATRSKVREHATRSKVKKPAACKKTEQKPVAPAKRTRRTVIAIDLRD